MKLSPQTAHQRRRRTAGICTSCPKKATHGVRCEKHWQAEKLRAAQRYREKQAAKVCPLCNKTLSTNATASGICVECNAKTVARNRDYRKTRRAAGLCIGCGKDPNGDAYACSTAGYTWSHQPKQGSPHCSTCFFKKLAGIHLGTTTRWQELKELFDTQRGCCAYTGAALILGATASIDHIVPLKQGGTNDLTNLQWATFRINLMKRDLPHSEFLALCEQVTNHRKA